MANRAYVQKDTIFLQGPVSDIRQYGTTFDSQVMLDAISEIGSNEVSLVIPAANWAVDQAVHFPSNITVYALHGAHFNIASNISLVFEKLIAGNYQLFYTNPANATVNNLNNRAWWGEPTEIITNSVVDVQHIYVKQLTSVPNAKPGYGYVCFTDDGKVHVVNANGIDVLASSLNSTDLLSNLKTVDGAGSGLDADLLDGQEGSYYLPAGTYTASDILTKLKTVDGAGSGLDADLLDGQEGSYYLPAGTYTASDVLTKLKTVDGAGSGLDADLLDGIDSVNLAKSQDKTGVDLNTIVDSGIYKLGGSNANMPSNVAYGQLLVLHGASDTIVQVAFGYQDHYIYWRSGSPSEVGGTGTWGAWLQVWNSANDGAGSGLDADLLDGLDSTQFITKSNSTYKNSYAASTSWTVVHNLGTYNVIVQCYSACDANGKLLIPNSITLNSTDQITVDWGNNSVAGCVCVIALS